MPACAGGYKGWAGNPASISGVTGRPAGCTMNRAERYGPRVAVPPVTPMEDDPLKYLDPLTLARVSSLELQARLVVEGYLAGMHKSPYHGFSVEFAQHREYVPG